jgi:uncharacterized protein (DUF1786 family)
MVKQMGFEIVDEHEAAMRMRRQELLHIELQDFDARALITALQAFDVDPRVDALAIAAFDHGAAPPGVSDRRFRFDFIAQTVQQDPTPSAFAYPSELTPTSLTRLQAIATSAVRYKELSGSSSVSPLLLMDTGSAAVLGSLEDLQVRQQPNTLLCNIGNFHTLAFHLVEGRIAGIFEHHTGEINRAQLEDMLVKLAQGTLTNDEVFNTSGHGALILDQSLPAHQNSALPFLAVTGPRREMLRGSSLHPYEATPHGDMMLAGCFGLLRALADHEPDLAPFITPSLLPNA